MQGDVEGLQLFILFPRHGMDFGRCLIREMMRSTVMRVKSSMHSRLGESQHSRNEPAPIWTSLLHLHLGLWYCDNRALYTHAVIFAAWTRRAVSTETAENQTSHWRGFFLPKWLSPLKMMKKEWEMVRVEVMFLLNDVWPFNTSGPKLLEDIHTIWYIVRRVQRGLGRYKSDEKRETVRWMVLVYCARWGPSAQGNLAQVLIETNGTHPFSWII